MLKVVPAQATYLAATLSQYHVSRHIAIARGAGTMRGHPDEVTWMCSSISAEVQIAKRIVVNGEAVVHAR